VGDVDVTGGLREVWERVWVREEELNLAEAERLDVLERSIHQLGVLRTRWCLRGVVDIRLLRVQDQR